jgi:uncharacterized membrane protein YraQ (UPF0718 family)
LIVEVAVGHELWQALSFSFGMFWEVLWALILGFTLSGAVQAVVSKREMRRLMPDDSPKTLAIASGLGAARLPVRMRLSRSRARSFARAPISRRRWPSSSRPRTW